MRSQECGVQTCAGQHGRVASEGSTFLILRSTGLPHISPVVKLPLTDCGAVFCNWSQYSIGPLAYRPRPAAWVPSTPPISYLIPFIPHDKVFLYNFVDTSNDEACRRRHVRQLTRSGELYGINVAVES